MFLVTQFIGLYVINAYTPQINPETGINENPLPFGMEPPEVEAKTGLISIAIAFVIAIALILILIKFRFKFLIRTWFFVVIALALGIVINGLLKNHTSYAWLIALIISVPFALLKIFRPSVIIHNFTELLIYPGIAAVFVPILSVWTVIIFLIAISIYDMWAVWHSGIMQKMAKFQMEELKVFGGFLVPYMGKKIKMKIKLLRQKIKEAKTKKAKEKIQKDSKIKVSLAILGGGDVVFPIIASGIFFRAFGIIPALLVIAGAFVGLSFLLSISQKKKFYPAMPFITTGIFLGMLVSWIWFI